MCPVFFHFKSVLYPKVVRGDSNRIIVVKDDCVDFHICQIALQFCTGHDSHKVLSSEPLQSDRTIREDVDERELSKFEC